MSFSKEYIASLFCILNNIKRSSLSLCCIFFIINSLLCRQIAVPLHLISKTSITMWKNLAACNHTKNAKTATLTANVRTRNVKG